MSRTQWSLLAAVIMVTALVYSNSIRHGYVLDDYSAITINQYVHEGFAGIPKLLTVDFWHFSNLQLGYYRPLSLITFAMEYQFFGEAPHVNHLFNLFYYLFLVMLVYLLAGRLFRGSGPFAAFAVTLMFALHPIHTEVVDNIKGRDELLSFLGVVSMLYYALRYLDTRKIGFLAASLFLFYLALLSKESSLAGIVLLPLVFYHAGKVSWKKAGLMSLPYLGVVFLFFIQRKAALGEITALIPDDLINYPYRDPSVKFSSACMMLLFGLRMLVWPHPLRYDYSYNQLPAAGWNSLWAAGGLLLLLVLLAAGWQLLKKRNPAGLSAAFFLAALIPMMAFILMRGGIFTERNLFAASLGFCLALAALPPLLIRKEGKIEEKFTLSELKRQSAWLIPVLVIALAYGFTTFQRNPAWSDPLTLFSTDIRTGEHSAQNQLHYGSELVMNAVNEKDAKVKDSLVLTGMQAIRKALDIHPRFGDALFRYGYGFEVMMTYRMNQANVDSAIYYFRKATENAPNLSDAYRHLGIIYEWMGRLDEALSYYNKAYEIDPQALDAQQRADNIRNRKTQ